MNVINNEIELLDILREALLKNPSIFAFWVEGSFAQGRNDKYSDIDLWLSVDDDKVFTVFQEIEQIFSEVGEINFKYIAKTSGELGHATYHIKDFNEIFLIDVNTQPKSRVVYLINGVDEAKILFDKSNILKFKDAPNYYFDELTEKQKLLAFYQWLKPSIAKNIHRNRMLEALAYYQQVVLRYVEYLRLKNDLSAKQEYGLKHIYSDLPQDAKFIEKYYAVNVNELPIRFGELSIFVEELCAK